MGETDACIGYLQVLEVTLRTGMAPLDYFQSSTQGWSPKPMSRACLVAAAQQWVDELCGAPTSDGVGGAVEFGPGLLGLWVCGPGPRHSCGEPFYSSGANPDKTALGHNAQGGVAPLYLQCRIHHTLKITYLTYYTLVGMARERSRDKQQLTSHCTLDLSARSTIEQQKQTLEQQQAAIAVVAASSAPLEPTGHMLAASQPPQQPALPQAPPPHQNNDLIPPDDGLELSKNTEIIQELLEYKKKNSESMAGNCRYYVGLKIYRDLAAKKIEIGQKIVREVKVSEVSMRYNARVQVSHRGIPPHVAHHNSPGLPPPPDINFSQPPPGYIPVTPSYPPAHSVEHWSIHSYVPKTLSLAGESDQTILATAVHWLANLLKGDVTCTQMILNPTLSEQSAVECQEDRSRKEISALPCCSSNTSPV
uniref:Uncharacterized protein n=1 Tax=Timema shepardi TaxID=629360 RepID=A0A7R9G1U5_TIMSH|nr:unnamed protein product [Timema shepardi]